MKTCSLYITRDAKEHRSLSEAESHCLANAATVLKNLMQEACPKLEGVKWISDAIIYKIVSDRESLSEFRSVMEWVIDSFSEDENESI